LRRVRTENLAAAAPVCGLAAGLLCGFDAPAQVLRSGPPPAGEQYQATTASQEPRYIMPDLAEKLAKRWELKSDWFTLKLGASIVIDYTAFEQDAASISQVGKQDDQWQAREVRLNAGGSIGSGYKIKYYVNASYNGFDATSNMKWNLLDCWLAFPLGSPERTLTVGKMKETFDYEMVSSFVNLPQQERILNPFITSRDVGLKLTQVMAHERMTLSGGGFSDWWVNGDTPKNGGADATARLTGLLWDCPDGAHYFHLGISGRYLSAAKDTLDYKGKPESNVADDFVDTGKFPGDHAWHLGLEALWNQGPLSILAEYNHAWTDSPSTGNPQFYGYYILASWVVTGENRPYDRSVGYTGRIIPKYQWGAPELVARFSRVNLDDETIQGGKFYKTYFGVNWWVSRQWKVGFGWGHTWLDRFGTTGVTDSFLTRLQWVF
jgi:phosphate-selective porin OprO/OprP